MDGNEKQPTKSKEEFEEFVKRVIEYELGGP